MEKNRDDSDEMVKCAKCGRHKVNQHEVVEKNGETYVITRCAVCGEPFDIVRVGKYDKL